MKFKKWVIACLILGIVMTVPREKDLVESMIERNQTFVLVIDPGHGGMDSGAVAKDGTYEKTLNLEICKAIRAEGQKAGMKVVMTREDDRGLYEEGSNRWNKGVDIRKRKEIIDNSGAELAITVHLNSFKEDSDVRGAQVFFPKNTKEQMYKENEQIGKQIQEYLTKGLNDGTSRKAMEKNNMFLLENMKVKTLLIECGFLSNEIDLQNLKNPKFQQKMAVYIIKAVKDWFS